MSPSRHDELLDQVLDHLLVVGVANISLRPLAQALGVSTYSLSYHFGSKEGLLEAAITRLEARQRQQIQQRLAVDSGPAAAIHATWAAMREHLEQDRLVLEVSVLLDLPISPARRRDLSRFWIDAIAQRLVQGGMPPERAEPEASLLQAALVGLEVDLLNTQEVERIERAVALLAATTAARWRPPAT